MIANRIPLLSSTLGTQRDIVSLTFGPQDAGMKVYVQASLHADETPAMLAAVLLRRRLQALESEGSLRARIVLVPVANPIGLSQHVMGQFFGCFELNGMANFNRGIPRASDLCAVLEGRLGGDAARNKTVIHEAMRERLDAQQPRTELESLRLALMKMAYDADVVLDIHCSLEAVVHLYTTNAAWPRLEPLARHLRSEAQLLTGDTGLGLFVEGINLTWEDLHARYGKTCALPDPAVAAILELGGEREVSYAAAQRHMEAIIAFLVGQGAIGGVAPAAPALRHPAVQLSASQHFNAPASGIVVYRAGIGDVVKAGDPICDIIDPITDACTTLTCHAEGVFYMRRAIRFVTAGAEIGRVTGRAAA
ncbi:succinylglutamate desuccinylase/aspartoacylase family protein [Bordetella genomosp. 13]|uniref:succinylglutamate desuccinylase/aspartoacylase domain-containing protein n=1 Tax=Bordetella genomosp. 13 TaxID=463040 RepID=UPI0011AA2847|nr:succinylglutamate desuccinylase/aspartoacylase family protein [Bordetella genomosp. 13]